MAPASWRFAGKTVFGSTEGGWYLTTWTAPGVSKRQLPAMAAKAATAKERCILYAGTDGALRIQLASLLWVTLNEDLGWLMLSADPAEAAAFTLAGTPPGQTWQVRISGGWAKIYYTVNNPSPILTTGEGGLYAFAPIVVTPPLDAIVAAKACRDGDLAHVSLQGQNVTGVDFTGAVFASATLDGATFTGTTLTRAVLDRATVGSARFDGAVLDSSSFQGADLTDSAWGSPKSARRVVLTGCHARRATLGGQQPPKLDCTEASLATGDFRGANLTGLQLTKAEAAGANLAGCKLDDATLDGANLRGAVAVGASLTGASLVGVDAQSALFIRADFTRADLTRARMGARAYVFTLPGTFAAELDTYRYVQDDLAQKFLVPGGIKLSPNDEVEVLAKGARWRVLDPKGPYDLILQAAGGIDVFNASPDLRPAVLRGAVCLQTKAPGASLSGADLRGVRWYSTPATLDHADLEGAVLAGSLLVQTDFTQAYLSGADLSGCVLVQALLKGCAIGPDTTRRPFSLEGALLQQTDFSATTLLAALVTDAAIALPQGVPLFSLDATARADLNAAGLTKLAPAFARAGYPLGNAPSITKVGIWLLDNSKDSDPNMPRTYRVQLVQEQLQVYDDARGGVLFELPSDDIDLLNAPTASQDLVDDFANAGYSLALGAPITAKGYSEIRTGGAPAVGPAAYPRMRVYDGPDRLPVYGSVLVTLRDWSEYPQGLAFAPTVAIKDALNAASVAPSGYPRVWFDDGLIDWTALMTAAPRTAL
jgi:uncharacterized protein YjbI with pentapeptide repeats